MFEALIFDMNAATFRTATSIMTKGLRKRSRPSPPAFRHLTHDGTDRTTMQLPPTTPPNNDKQQRQHAQQTQPLSLGYVAGLQCQSDDTPWNSFDEAYDLLRQVDPAVLHEFETNLWQQDGMKFVHSTKDVSVIDMSVDSKDSSSPCHGGSIIRSLVLNARPTLIQSSIEIECVGAAGPKVFGTPPPLVGPTATHLGGLALALPLWLACGEKTDRDERKKPSAVVLGAGGCTIPAVLAKAKCHVTAIELNENVRYAACHYFGASDDGGVELLAGFGEDYLMTRRINNSNDDVGDNICGTAIDVLIIDAEDGKSAPPSSMREESFWSDAVVPSLSPNGVVAVNVIANQEERNKFTRMVSEVMKSHHIWCCQVPSIAKVSNRHSLMFATPKAAEEGGMDIMTSVKKEMDKFNYVDMKLEWMKEIESSRMFRCSQSRFLVPS